eukprot:749940-Hanusia_phi.AAC.2
MEKAADRIPMDDKCEQGRKRPGRWCRPEDCSSEHNARERMLQIRATAYDHPPRGQEDMAVLFTSFSGLEAQAPKGGKDRDVPGVGGGGML